MQTNIILNRAGNCPVFIYFNISLYKKQRNIDESHIFKENQDYILAVFDIHRAAKEIVLEE